MRRLSRTLACAAFVSILLASPAAALEPGTIVIAACATTGVADFVSPPDPWLSAYDHGEIGVQGQGWVMLDSAWGLTLSGGVARIRERNEQVGLAARYYQQRAWSARVGVDRMIPVTRDAVLYFGPGVEYWTGHANFIGYYAEPVVEAPEVTRWSGSGRFGALLVITDSVGLTGHLGYRMGYATASEGASKSAWYTTGYEAGAGLAFAF